MNFDDYQVKARATAIYPTVGNNLWYPALGLCGEAGEVAEKIKKIYRDKDGIVTLEDRAAITKELGDSLWYISNVASELQVSLDVIACLNIEKLRARADTGKLHGEGDSR